MPRISPATSPRAADGRVPGRRGLATRQRLLDCTTALLGKTPYRDLKVTDITRSAGTSPATFYQYFVDIESVVLLLADQTADAGAELAHLVEGQNWRGSAGLDAAHRFIDTFLDFWTEHRPVLRVVNLLTEEGDARFRAARFRMLNTVTRALAAAIQEANPKQSHDAAMAMSGALVAMVAQVASHQPGFAASGIPLDEVREAMSRLLYWGITSPRLPRR